jgi:hypothetical protein
MLDDLGNVKGLINIDDNLAEGALLGIWQFKAGHGILGDPLIFRNRYSSSSELGIFEFVDLPNDVFEYVVVASANVTNPMTMASQFYEFKKVFTHDGPNTALLLNFYTTP